MRWLKILKWAGLILLGLMAVFMIYNMRMSFRTSDEKTEDYFEKRKLQAQIHRIAFGDRELRYISTCRSEEEKPVVLFVHGAPGSADNFHRYLADEDLLQRAHLITMDRPGYGYSSYGHSAPSLVEQAQAVRAILDQYPLQRAILVGHSYGGPILGRCALDFPDRLDGIIMLAPVNNPDSEPFHRLSIVTQWRLTRWIFSKAWRVAGDEKHQHIEELRAMADDWRHLRVPTVHIHGVKDFLAPIDNIDFSRERIPEDVLKTVVLPKSSHFTPWTNYEVVKAEILEVLAANSPG